MKNFNRAVICSTLLLYGLSAQSYIGGKRAQVADAPGAVTLIITSDRLEDGDAPEKIEICSASVIAPHWILTAMHCVMDRKVTKVRLSRTEDFLMKPLGSDLPQPGKDIAIKRVHRYPGFKNPQKSKLIDIADVALIELKSAIDIVPIALASSPAFPGEVVHVGGWGIPAASSDPNVKIIFQGEDLTQLPNHLRYSPRKIESIHMNMFSLSQTPFAMNVEFSKYFDAPFVHAGIDPTKIRKEIVRTHQYEHISEGDSGGPVYRLDGAGKSAEVLGVNSLEDDLDGKANKIRWERFARVDAQSAAGKWIRKLMLR